MKEEHKRKDRKVEMAFQVANVQTALGSVIRLCAAGKRVVFDDDEGGGYIEDKITCQRTNIVKADGMYIVNL